jgi:hypothetical protein
MIRLDDAGVIVLVRSSLPTSTAPSTWFSTCAHIPQKQRSVQYRQYRDDTTEMAWLSEGLSSLNNIVVVPENLGMLLEDILVGKWQV